MLSESRRKKLEMLMRSMAANGQPSGGADLLRAHGHSGVNRAEGAPLSPDLTHLIGPVRPVPLHEACSGVETTIDLPQGAGRFWLVRRSLQTPEAKDGLDPQAPPVARDYSQVLRGARQNFDELEASAPLCHAANARPEELLFMDIETCGLAGNVIFLVGVMFHQDGALMCEQYFARDYSEESAILQAFMNRYNECRVLVTFNGKTFDLTQISERSSFHRVELPDRHPPHLDLLHEARKRWKGQVPNCKLQTLERHFCGRHRTGDIPGSAIPDAYHDFVRTQDARRVADILHHNALDLLTMAQLLTIVLTGCEPPRE